ncbi:MAG: GNAT family N-acetyltransferase [Bacteroidota bacterium]
MNITLRPIRPAEHDFLQEMLYEALFVPVGKAKFPKSILQEPGIRKYVKDWGQQKNDVAIVAVCERELVGAIWGRTFSANQQGYGYIDEQTPEISMAVKQSHRNQGIGTHLLKALETAYADRGAEKMSLSVDKLNPAKSLYQRCGFRFFEEKGTAITMVKEIKC